MSDDETFLAEFEACRWPVDQWRHREHIKLAYLCLREQPFEQALSRIRHGLKAFNAAHNTPDSLTRGYHETITRAWLCLVNFVLEEYGPAADADAFCDEHPELSERTTLRLYYSRDRLISLEAKHAFCEPDLAPFPVSRKERFE